MTALRTVTIALAALLAFTGAAASQTLVYEGYLTENGGEAVEGKHELTFTLYDGERAIWAERHDAEITGGHLAVELGRVVVLEPGLFAGPRTLGLAIDGEELTPRQVVGTVPSALVCEDARGDIHPTSISVGGQVVVNERGEWAGGLDESA